MDGLQIVAKTREHTEIITVDHRSFNLAKPTTVIQKVHLYVVKACLLRAGVPCQNTDLFLVETKSSKTDRELDSPA